MLVTFNTDLPFWEEVNRHVKGYSQLSKEQAQRLVDKEVAFITKLFIGQLLLAGYSLRHISLRFQPLEPRGSEDEAPWALLLGDHGDPGKLRDFVRCFTDTLDGAIELVNGFAPGLVVRLLKEERPGRHGSSW